MNGKRIVVVGATSGIAEHCGRLWLVDASELILLGRDESKLSSIRKDFNVRGSQVKITTYTLDFLNQAEVTEVVDRICAIGTIDIVLIAHAIMPLQIDCQNDLNLIANTININTTSVIWFSELFLKYFERANHGNLAIISSIAGDRGRRTNYLYGATKALLNCYVEGLQNRLANSKVKVLLIKPGPTTTPLTSQITLKFGKFAKPEQVATDIVNALNKGKEIVYTPYKWKFIMFFVRVMPKWLFNKLSV